MVPTEIGPKAIRARNLSGTDGPGQRIVIDALANEFGVSELPVREAGLLAWKASKPVIHMPNAGADVAAHPAARVDEEIAVLEGYATTLVAAAVPRHRLPRQRRAEALRDRAG